MTREEAEALAEWLRSQRPDVHARATISFRSSSAEGVYEVMTWIDAVDERGKTTSAGYKRHADRAQAEAWLSSLPPILHQTSIFDILGDERRR
jgi:hypothetical protein